MNHAPHHVSTSAAHDDVWYFVASHEESRECVRDDKLNHQNRTGCGLVA